VGLRFLDPARLAAVDPDAFRARQPFPWAGPEGLLRPDAWEVLHAALPDASLFQPIFGKPRRFGQRPHDRYVLEWSPDLPLPEVWRAFVGELRGPEYRGWLARRLGRRAFALRFHWHYTPAGCSVSPHCDARDKLGSHLFYFNHPDAWEEAWGGQTVLLDDGGRLDRRSSPEFEDFRDARVVSCTGNTSLLFARTDHSWHGVRELVCPPGRLRRVFVVVIETPGLRDRIRALAPLGAC